MIHAIAAAHWIATHRRRVLAKRFLQWNRKLRPCMADGNDDSSTDRSAANRSLEMRAAAHSASLRNDASAMMVVRSETSGTESRCSAKAPIPQCCRACQISRFCCCQVDRANRRRWHGWRPGASAFRLCATQVPNGLNNVVPSALSRSLPDRPGYHLREARDLTAQQTAVETHKTTPLARHQHRRSPSAARSNERANLSTFCGHPPALSSPCSACPAPKEYISHETIWRCYADCRKAKPSLTQPGDGSVATVTVRRHAGFMVPAKLLARKHRPVAAAAIVRNSTIESAFRYAWFVCAVWWFVLLRLNSQAT